MTSGLLGALAALAVTIAVLALAVRVARRWGYGLGGHPALPLAVLQRTALGPRQHVALVRVGERVLIVSQADGGVRLLGELDGEARMQALATLGVTPPRRSVLRALLPLVAGLLLVLPAGLAGQAPADPPAAAAAAPARPVAAPARPVAAPARVTAPTPPRLDLTLGSPAAGLHLEGAVGIVVLLTVLTLLPTLFLLMTSFTRILVVLHFLRMALGTQNAPPTQLLVTMAVLLTGMVMQPVLTEANRDALQPYLEGRMEQVEAYRTALVPFRRFMLANTRETDLAVFAEISGADSVAQAEDLPVTTIASAFITSELRTSFQIGFAIFLPFVVIDLIVASVLVSMGMFMLPPVLVSLPFKLLLFTLADGWTLIVRSLVAGFRT